MPHCVNTPRATLRFCHITPSQFCFVVAKYLTQTHTYVRPHIHARTDPNAVHSTRNEDKRLEFRVWHQTCFSSRWPATPSGFCILLSLITPSQVCSLLQTKNKKTETTWKNAPLSFALSFFFLSGNKNKLNGKTQVFFYLFFFSNSRHNVYQYSNLSVCLHSQVQCANVASHKLLDCLLIRRSLQLTSLLSVL